MIFNTRFGVVAEGESLGQNSLFANVRRYSTGTTVTRMRRYLFIACNSALTDEGVRKKTADVLSVVLFVGIPAIHAQL